MGNTDSKPSNAASHQQSLSGCPVPHENRSADLNSSSSCPSPKNQMPTDLSQKPLPGQATPLETNRVVSSIPTADGSADSKFWVYPSEQMFFDAMRRKNWDPNEVDMKTVVPIHNAVNERAWSEILEWEKGRGGAACGGPKLVSFKGDSTKLSPRARMNTWLGYKPPFDRHDWTVDRCGKQVDYIIDFYSGQGTGIMDGKINFYIDVRPKLNLEGAKMRFQRWAGQWIPKSETEQPSSRNQQAR